MRLVSPVINPIKAFFCSSITTPIDLALGLAVLFLCLLSLPMGVVSPGLDASWVSMLPFLMNRGAQAGVDYHCTHGPLGYFLHGIFDERLFWPRYLSEIAAKAIVVGVLISSFGKISRGQFYLGVVVLSVGLPWSMDAQWILFAYLTILGILYERWGGGTELLLIAFLGLLALTKFTFFVFTFLAIGILILFSEVRRHRRLPFYYLGGMALGWIFAGQSISGFPRFLRGAWEIAQGHSASMGAPGKLWELVPALILMGALLTFSLLREPFRRRAVGRLMTTSLVLLLLWKQAFVRHDAHSLAYFVFMLTILFYLPWWPSGTRRGFRKIVVAGWAVLALLGIRSAFEGDLGTQFAAFPDRVTSQLSGLLFPRQLRKTLIYAEDRASKTYSLPRVKAHVGQNSIDLMGYSQGIMILNRFNYTPRPVFQSYQAYTPFLAAENAEFFRSPRAPDFVLVQVAPIDDRFPMIEDGPALVEVLRRYRPILIESEYTLFEKIPLKSRELPLPKALRVEVGKMNPLSGEGTSVLLSLDIRYSWLGKLVGFFFRPPIVYLDVVTEDGKSRRFRCPPLMAQGPFLLSPLITGARDLMNWENLAPKVASWGVNTSPRNRKFFRELVPANLSVDLSAGVSR